MARSKVNAAKGVVERNLTLTGRIMRFLVAHPQVFRSLPDEFELVILPEDDPAIRQYNLELLDKYSSAGCPVVFARLKAHADRRATEAPPSLFVPLSGAV